uniref:F-box domain-containing protein n=1 Tax=Leersia perrieri TaxID=77586 RepID=A0A0D9W454_9ORYZ
MESHQTCRRPNKQRRINPTPASPAAAAAVPIDVLFSHILVNLPVKSLVRLKAVCRSWRAAIDDPAFVRRHLELTRARPSSSSLLAVAYTDDEYWDYPYHVDDPPEYIASFHRLRLGQGSEGESTVTAETDLLHDKSIPEESCDSCPRGLACHTTHCDGLVAGETQSGIVFVCNPSTKEFVSLPPVSTPKCSCNDYVTEIDGELCYVRHNGEDGAADQTYDVWTAAVEGPSASPNWSPRCRVPPMVAWHSTHLRSFVPFAVGGGEINKVLALFREELFVYDEQSEPQVKAVDLQSQTCEFRHNNRGPDRIIRDVLHYVESLVSIRARNY